MLKPSLTEVQVTLRVYVRSDLFFVGQANIDKLFPIVLTWPQWPLCALQNKLS